MKLSTKARYAVTAMMDLALHEKARPVTLADISHYQGISLSYLEQLFAKLRKKGLVSGVRGPGGGYRLARPSSDISIAEVVEAINGDEEHVFKGEAPDEPNNDREMLEVMWSDLSGKIHEFLDHITLDEFVRTRTEGAAPAAGETSTEYGEARHERSEAA